MSQAQASEPELILCRHLFMCWFYCLAKYCMVVLIFEVVFIFEVHFIFEGTCIFKAVFLFEVHFLGVLIFRHFSSFLGSSWFFKTSSFLRLPPFFSRGTRAQHLALSVCVLCLVCVCVVSPGWIRCSDCWSRDNCTVTVSVYSTCVHTALGKTQSWIEQEYWHERQCCMVPRLWPYGDRHFLFKTCWINNV